MGFRRGPLEPTLTDYIETRRREQRRLERITRALQMAAGKPRIYDWKAEGDFR